MHKQEINELGSYPRLRNGKRKRQRRVLLLISVVGCIIMMAFLIAKSEVEVNLHIRNQQPGLTHIFGTDWLGRDMFLRTMQGLNRSLFIGLVTAMISTFFALVLCILAWWHSIWDAIISWFADLFLSLPHLVMLVLISFTFGGGAKGLMIGLVLTHWPKIFRLLRGEVLQLKQAPFIQVSVQFGKSKGWIAVSHLLPILLPQMMVACVLLFPHIILHEAAVTFLGFGLPPEQPAIGTILSESMDYLTAGIWWMAFFPGLILLISVFTVDWAGRQIKNKMIEGMGN